MDDYYVNQAGSGLGGFSGVRYQKGDGFFGRMMSGSILPIIKKVLPYLGRQALATANDIAGDLSQGEKLKESFNKRFKSAAGRVGQDAMAKVRQLSGSGRRKRKRRVAVCKNVVKKRVTKRRRTKRKGTKRRYSKKKASDFL
jgi:hypothetical protein